ncbi:hypothetical protein HF086_010622 [Spodoptera exigua]|uniref:Uncharacterized protein n=1 Tax=Spodoptera exigua TaxID=7107 RepID=A0A922MVF2_SPOEX|nr:hypothetical protein HF086_010622 [Spodoptera exigua]
MYNLKACVVCFSANVKLISLNSCKLRQEFQIISGIKTRLEGGMPDYLCFQCAALVRKFIKFRSRCQRAHYALKEILNRNDEINETILSNLDRNLLDIMPPLSFMSPDKPRFEQVKFQWKKQNRIDWCNTAKNDIHVVHCSTLTADDTFNEVTNTEVLEFTEEKIKRDIDDVVQEQINIEYELPKNESQSFENNTNVDAEMADSLLDNDHMASDNEQDLTNLSMFKVESTAVDGSAMDEEYATIVPISVKEAKAVIEVYKMFTQGKYHCKVCNKAYNNEERMNIHLRMHDKHVSGNYHCGLCRYYYKTEFLLKTHMTEKHLYKYICRKCPEVSFDRTSAKQHYIWTHLQNGSKKDANWYESRPKWIKTRGGKRVKGVVTLKPVRKSSKLPDDFLIYSPIGHEEQYTLIQERQKSRNYQEAKYQCHLCYRGFRLLRTYNKHMNKHDPCGKFLCNDVQARKHYEAEHPDTEYLKRYMCDVCGHTTRELETAGMSTPLTLAPPPHKIAAYDAPADYLNAYITYNDD